MVHPRAQLNRYCTARNERYDSNRGSARLARSTRSFWAPAPVSSSRLVVSSDAGVDSCSYFGSWSRSRGSWLSATSASNPSAGRPP